MWLLYQIAVFLVLVIVGPILLLSRGRHYWQSLSGRLGRYRGPIPEAPLWIHAVSVGEVGVAATLIRSLPEDLPLLVTTITPTGQQRALAGLRDRAAVAYLPFDLGFPIRRFLNRFAPRALILVEGDLWPLLLAHAKRRGLPVFVVNGRVSDRSFRRMRRVGPVLGPLLQPVDRFGVQSDQDRQRLAALGVAVERIVVTGNLKFDSPAPPAKPSLEEAIRTRADGRQVLVVGSTMSGEEAQVLQAFAGIGGGRRALLVLAPRHPERWPEVESLVRSHGLKVAKRSRLDAGPARPDVLLLDSLGELATVYGLGCGCFIGGTLVATGGHNPLEAAWHAVPIAAGPSMENFREIALAFDRAAAWRRVASAEELARAWDQWLAEPEVAAELGARGAAMLAAQRGALSTTLQFLRPILRQPSEPAPPSEPSPP